MSAIARLADACVRCGLCLPHCPTYWRDQTESSSPRGRIVLLQALAQGQDLAGAQAVLDPCLNCLRCESACPAKVQFGKLMDAGRAHFAPPSWAQRVLLWILASPSLSAWLVRALRYWPAALSRARVQALKQSGAPKPALAACTQSRAGVERLSVQPGCSGASMESDALAAFVRLHRRFCDQELAIAPARCCGAMHRHFGLPAWAEQLKARMPAASIYWQAGCQSQMPPESFDALSFAAQRWPPFTAARAAGTKVALWLPCLLSASADRAGAVRAWWQASLGQALLKLPEQLCCGAGGLKFGAAAGDALADRVLNSALDAGCKTLLALGSCALQLRARALSRKLALEIAHPFVWLEKIGEFT